MESCLTALVEFRHVGKGFKKQILFKQISFTIRPGEVYGLLGPSGSGKSTILKMIAGLETPTFGNLSVTTRNIGYVFQEPRLLPWHTALENVVAPLLAIGKNRQTAGKEALISLEEMGLAGFENHYPAELSGGMKQRVSIARALAVKPDLLLLDEPFTGLDPDLRQSVKERLESVLKKSTAGVIHVTHDVNELINSTKRIYQLGPGGINGSHPLTVTNLLQNVPLRAGRSGGYR